MTAGENCTVNVAFTPSAPGLRRGAVKLLNSSGTILATAYLSGTGTGPLVDFSTSTATTVTGLTNPQGVVADAAGNLHITSAVNSVSAAQSVQMENDGNLPLNVTVPSSGVNLAVAGPYVLGNSGTCAQISSMGTTQTLASGRSCTDAIPSSRWRSARQIRVR